MGKNSCRQSNSQQNLTRGNAANAGGARSVQPAMLDYAAAIEHDGRAHEVRVPQLSVARCESCGDIVLDDDANEHISEAFRSQLGLLTPVQIRHNRERLGLTQWQLASLPDTR